jgi:protein-S-isoprenylcysteine O-methyltransferase Ste14
VRVPATATLIPRPAIQLRRLIADSERMAARSPAEHRIRGRGVAAESSASPRDSGRLPLRPVDPPRPDARPLAVARVRGGLVSRCLVTAVFALMSLTSAVGATHTLGAAAAEPTLRAWALACYSLLSLALVIAFSIFVLLRAPSRNPCRDPIAFLACAAAIGTVVVQEAPSRATTTSLVVAGDIVAVVACAWMLVSVLALGRCFGVLPEARGLVTRGPYRLVRHPLYLGEFGAVAGLVLASPAARNLAAAVIFAGAQAVRMRLEERALAAEFVEYADYAARTPRLVPSVLRAHESLWHSSFPSIGLPTIRRGTTPPNS